MTTRGNATKAIFNAIAKETFLRAQKWFREHPEEPFCYWAKDDFIKIADKENKQLLDAHPEIEDINDHTIVQFDLLTDTVYLSKFCPKLRAGLQDMVNAGYFENTIDGYHWRVFHDDGNFKVMCYEED